MWYCSVSLQMRARLILKRVGNCFWHQCNATSTTAPFGALLINIWDASFIFAALYALYRALSHCVYILHYNRMMDRHSEHMAGFKIVLCLNAYQHPTQSVFIGIRCHHSELNFKKVITENWRNPRHYKSSEATLTAACWRLKCYLTFLSVETQYCTSLSLCLGCTGARHYLHSGI